jgi:hypothetical protein
VNEKKKKKKKKKKEKKVVKGDKKNEGVRDTFL